MCACVCVRVCVCVPDVELGGHSSTASPELELVRRRYLIGLEVSERPMKWPLNDDGRARSVFSAYHDIRRAYSNLIDRCHFDDMCAVSSCNSVGTNFGVGVEEARPEGPRARDGVLGEETASPSPPTRGFAGAL